MTDMTTEQALRKLLATAEENPFCPVGHLVEHGLGGADALRAALSKPVEQHDPLAVSDHCPECSEPEPECVCGEQPAERESRPLTFTQGVLCSLSILDGYGDSIAYREVANPHDPNQLWEEADEFDREHLARHGYRPTPAAQESGDASN